MLLDRRTERGKLAEQLDAARAGHSSVLVMRGEPGVGKTALLEDTITSAAGMRLARIAGVEAEMELAFAALQQLSAPMIDHARALPEPQRRALEVAFGLRIGDPPDPFIVGLAALGLLSEAAGERPLLCVIDDAQWLDEASAQALAFVARRLLAEPVAMVFATREPGANFAGLPEQYVAGLPDDDAQELLSAVTSGPLDKRVRDQLVAEARGNPLALLELAQWPRSAQLAGGFGVIDVHGASGQIEESFTRRLDALPPDARRLMLVAAADPTGDAGLVRRAAGRLAIGAGALAHAEADRLLTIGHRVTFRHPMVRSTVYRAAPPQERRDAHRALADATDHGVDPDRRAWHSALATVEPDEEVALDLERSADRARARGGRAAEAAFLGRSAALTVDPARRAERALAAAQATIQAGAFDAALGLLATAEAAPLGGLEHAQADLLRGQIAFSSSRGSDAAALLLKAARQFEVLDTRLARETYLEALGAAIFASRLAVGGDMREVAQAVRTAPAPQQPAPAPDLLLDGLAALVSAGYRAGVPILKKAVSAFRSADLPVEEGLRWLWLACHAAGIIWDYDSWDVLSARQIKLARDTGAIIALPIAFNTRAGVDLLAGEFAAADAMVAEAQVVGEVTQSSIAPYGAVALAAFRGSEADAVRRIEAATEDIRHRGEGEGLSFVHWATAVLWNGHARYEQALSAAQQAQDDDSPALWFANWAAVELVEASARLGRPDQAADAIRRVSETTQAAGTNWALGVEARSRALVSHGDAAESRYREAVDRLGHSGLRLELGRARLVYGEWLRRERRRRDARGQLARAYEIFTRSGAMAFAGRARIELRACGGLVHEQPVDTRDPLTAQEALIARLAAAGSSNPDIAAQLFISRATVAYHLRKIFTKLDISSRNELAQVLSAERR